MRAVVPLCALITTLVLCSLAHVWIAEAGHRSLELTVNPRALLPGGAFWLTCRVDPDPRNRLLDYGVVNFREHSQRQLDGENSAITYRALIEHVPCDVGPAYCQLLRSDGSKLQAVQDLVIGGCDR